MDPSHPKVVRSPRKGPFPGSFQPLKLRQLLQRAGIEPTPKGHIPWGELPSILYNKGLYITGLPARLFFEDDKPSREDIDRRLNETLKWPPPGIISPLKILEKACMVDDLVKMLQRPAGREVVFELIRDDGSTFDLGKWKATPPPAATTSAPPKLALTSEPRPVSTLQRTDTMIPAGQSNPVPKKLTELPSTQRNVKETPKATTNATIQKVSASKKEPYPKSTTVPLEFREMLHSIGVPESKSRHEMVGWSTVPHILWEKGLYITGIPSSVILDSKNPEIEMVDRKMKASFAPKAFQLLDAALKKGEVKLLKRPPGRDVVFEVITGGGPYDLGKWMDKDPPRPIEHSTKSFEIISKSISKPIASKSIAKSTTLKTSSKPFAFPPLQQKTQPIESSKASKVAKTTGGTKPIRRNTIILDSSDEDAEPPTPASALPSAKSMPVFDTVSNPFPGSINVPANLRRLLESAGVKEHSNKDVVPWADVPYVLWRNGLYISGLPRNFVLGKNTPEEVITKQWQPQEVFRTKNPIPQRIIDDLSNGKIRVKKREDARNVVFEIKDSQGRLIDIGRWTAPEPIWDDSDVEMEEGTDDEETSAHPMVKWYDHVNKVMDQLAEMLVEAGVELPAHEKRKGAYKIPWSELPRLLHQAEVRLGGFPLALLPYWRSQARLNGRWAIKWTRESLDNVEDLLDCDAIVVEKWPDGNLASPVVVQAFDPNNDQYDFTYDDFLNAEVDDPEHFVLDGKMLPGLPEEAPINRRRRRASIESVSDRPPKRHKSKHVPTSSSSTIDVIELLDDSAANTTEAEGDGSDVEIISESTTGTVQSRGLMADILLDPDNYQKQFQDEGLPVSQLNAKAQRQKRILKELISILMYFDIPCIAPADERLAFFVPWGNLPRYLAARNVCMAGLPDVCAPVVVEDTVVPEWGPASWEDSQWDALEAALENNAINVKKINSKMLFELVSANGTKNLSPLTFSKDWLRRNIGIEAGHSSISAMADSVSPMDPILIETDDEESDTDDSMQE